MGGWLGLSARLAPTPAHDALHWLFRSLVGTTATVVSKSKTGRIRASWQSTYSYCIRNYGGFSWFHGRGRKSKEL